MRKSRSKLLLGVVNDMKGWRYPRKPQKRRELAAYLMNVKKYDGIVVDALLGHFRTALHSIENQRDIAQYLGNPNLQNEELDRLKVLEVDIKKMKDDENYFKERVDVYLSQMEKEGFHLPPLQRSERLT